MLNMEIESSAKKFQEQMEGQLEYKLYRYISSCP